jgi:hypothetical protein
MREVIGNPCLHKYGEMREVIGNQCLNKYGEIREVIGNPCLNKYGELREVIGNSCLNKYGEMREVITCSDTDYLSLPSFQLSILVQTRITDHVPLLVSEQVRRDEGSDR